MAISSNPTSARLALLGSTSGLPSSRDKSAVTELFARVAPADASLA